MGGLISKHQPLSPSDDTTDMEILEFDRQVHAKTIQILTTIGTATTPELEAPLSFSSLREVTECLLDMNQQVVNIILHCKKDIWNNKELFDLVEDYFDNSLRNLDFCSSLEKCLKKARDNQLLILMALQHLQESRGGEAHFKALNQLKELNITDPFTQEFFQLFQSVYTHQLVMLEKLRSKKTRLDKKLRFIHAWRRVCGAAFVVTLAAVLICAVVAAAIAAPPVAAALSAATSIPLGSVGKWVDSLWNNCEGVLKRQKEVIGSMQVGAFVVIQDMDNIRSLIGRLQVEMESLIPQGCIVGDGEGMVASIDSIKNKLGVFMSDIECLSVHAYTCSRDIRKARTVVLQRIIKHNKHPDEA